MAPHEFKDLEDLQRAMQALMKEKPEPMAGMGVITFVASAIEKLTAEVIELKKSKG